MFKGETNQSHFFMPLLHADTVVDAIVDTLVGGLSRTIYLPGIFRLFAGLVSFDSYFNLRLGQARSVDTDCVSNLNSEVRRNGSRLSSEIARNP